MWPRGCGSWVGPNFQKIFFSSNFQKIVTMAKNINLKKNQKGAWSRGFAVRGTKMKAKLSNE